MNNNNFEEIKKLIAESRDSVIAAFKKDLNDVKDTLTSFHTRVTAVEDEVNKLQFSHANLANEINAMKNNTKKLKREIREECLEEFENRLQRLHNVVLIGLPEKESGTRDDRIEYDESRVNEVLKEIGIRDVRVSECRRIGKKRENGSRLLKIKINDINKKKEILSKSKTLKTSQCFKKVFIHHDLTPMQQEEQRKLREELAKRRGDGEDVVIFRGKVRNKTESQNF